MASRLYDEYAELTQTYKAKYGNDTVVLMEIGSFFEYCDCDQHLGADVPRVSQILNIETTRWNKAIPEVSRTNPIMGGFPIVAAEKYINLILDAGFTVVRCSCSPPHASDTSSNKRLEVTEVKLRRQLQQRMT